MLFFDSKIFQNDEKCRFPLGNQDQYKKLTVLAPLMANTLFSKIPMFFTISLRDFSTPKGYMLFAIKGARSVNCLFFNSKTEGRGAFLGGKSKNVKDHLELQKRIPKNYGLVFTCAGD